MKNVNLVSSINEEKLLDEIQYPQPIGVGMKYPRLERRNLQNTYHSQLHFNRTHFFLPSKTRQAWVFTFTLRRQE